MNQFSLDLAFKRKDAGIALVSDDWIDCAYQNVLQLHPSLPAEFTSNDIRNLIAPFVGKPKSNNAYGALMNRLQKHLVFTGKVCNSSRPDSHSRCLKIYVWK